MKRNLLAIPLLGIVVALASAVTTGATKDQAQKDNDEPVLKCPVSGRPVSKEVSIDYRGGKLHFCCPGCPAGFEKDPPKYAAKANHQLIASRQAEQVACPLTGREINPDTAGVFDGVMVGFCCNGCKTKIQKADDPQRRELLFGDRAFEKGFKIKQQQKDQG